jgi:hypothetical protein
VIGSWFGTSADGNQKHLCNSDRKCVRNPFSIQLRFEPLEDRCLLSLGDLLQTLADPSTNPQVGCFFGNAVAADGNLTVAGAYQSDLQGYGNVGRAYVLNSTTGVLVATLINPTPADSDCFGNSVAISGNTVVVGAYGDNTGATHAGAAYIFDATTGNLLYTLANPTPAAYDYFGYSVAISGNTVVVGAYQDDTGATDAGTAYIFDATTGNLLHTLANPTPAAYDNFGNSVAISGNTVVVGAYKDDTGATDAGAAYIFNATTGNLLRTLANPTPAASNGFGISVAISGNNVVVGADGDDTGATDAGTAYIFDATTGNLLRTLANPTPAVSDYFGYSVAISGNTVVVGAYQDDTGATNSGAAYIFDATGNNLLRTLTNPTPAGNDYFGNSVAISGNIAVVGAYQDDTGATDAGAVYIFDATPSSLLQTLPNPTPTARDWFGSSVAISGNNVVVGTPYDDTGASDAGAVYIYTETLFYTLANPTPAIGDCFGYSVAIDGNNVVIGTPYDDTDATNSGSAYIYNASGNLLFTLANPTPIAGDYFGYCVAISGNNVVVGAYGDDTGAIDSGSAYVFDATTGKLVKTLANPTLAAGDYFGISVAVYNNTVIVGADNCDTGATNAGAAYIFDATTGNLLHTLANPTPAANDYFGSSVAVSGNNVVVGAYQDDTGATNSGAAYILDATTGNLLRTLTNLTPVANDNFGYSVAISDNTVVIGTPYYDTTMADSGAAYIFDATTGNPLNKLANPTPAAGDRFGYSVAVSGNTVVVGEAFLGTVSADAGAAYIFNAPTVDVVCSIINSTTPAASDSFGYSVAISGNTVVVGTPYNDTGAIDAGVVYIFDATTGNLLRTLANPTPAAGDYFGYSVAISGNIVVVGAYKDDTGATDSGTAYIFDATTGSLLRTLANPTPASSDYFGYSVAVSSNSVVVGAYGDDTGASNAGAAYIFNATTGSLLRTLANPTPAANDYFGSSVAVSGNNVVVGAHQDDTGATDSGTAYIFDTTTGNLLRTLANPTPAASDYFGKCVAVSGNSVVVGAYRDDTGAIDAGAAYIFDATTGSLLCTLANPTPASGDWFGSSLAISGNTVVVGAYGDDTGATDAGAAYIFDTTTGNLVRTLTNPTPIASDNFGYSVAISASIAAVGTPYQDGITFDRGAAYLFDVNRPPTDITLSASSVPENSASGTIVGNLSTTDPDSGQTFTYTLLDSAGGRFKVVSNQLQVDNGTLLDYESNTSHNVTIRTTDSGGLSYDKTFVITVINLSETRTWDGGSLVNNLWTTKENWVDDVTPLPGDNLVFPTGAARLTNFNDFAAGTLFGSVTVSGSGYNLQGNPYQSSKVEVQPNAQLEVGSVNTGILSLGIGSRITISPIPGGPGTTSSAVASPKTTAIQAIKPTSYDTSDPNPIASSESESTTIVPTAVQQQLTIIDMKTATTLAASNDPVPIPCLESRLETNVATVSEHVISTADSTPDAKLFNSSATRQIETVTSRSLPQLPIYWWFDTKASYTRAIEEHFSTLISENRLNDPKDRLSTSSLDELSSTEFKAVKHPAAVITGSQNVHNAAFQSITQNSTGKNGDGQVEELDLEMLSSIHSKTQTKQFENAVDALLAVDLL